MNQIVSSGSPDGSTDSLGAPSGSLGASTDSIDAPSDNLDAPLEKSFVLVIKSKSS